MKKTREKRRNRKERVGSNMIRREGVGGKKEWEKDGKGIGGGD